MGTGVRVSFLSEEKKEPKEKSDCSLFSRKCYFVQSFSGDVYIGSIDYSLSPLIHSKSQRRFLLAKFVAHASYNLT